MKYKSHQSSGESALLASSPGGTSESSPRRRVIAALRCQIRTGQFSPGQRLEPEHELAARFGVSRGTVRAGLEELAQAGLLEKRRGFGCYVSRTLPSPESDPRQRTITFLIPLGKQRSLYDEILSGAEAVANAESFDIALVNLERKPPAEEVCARLKAAPPAGIIFSPLMVENYYEANSRFIEMFEENHFPYVVVDSPVANAGIIRGNFVGADGYGASREVVRHLAAAGHRKIGSIRVFPGVYTASQRFNGLVDQLRAEGLAFDPARHLTIEQCDIHEQGRPMARALMKLADPPTAIVCSHDTLALNVIDELRKLGFRVPEDVSVFGFDDDKFAEILKLSTVRQPCREIGARAAQMLAELHRAGERGPTVQRRQEFLPCELVIRGTSASPRPAESDISNDRSA